MIVRSFWVCIAATALLACGGDDDAAVSTASPANEPITTAEAEAATTPPPTTQNTTTTSPVVPIEPGLDWVRVTDHGGAFDGATLSDITSFASGWVAVGVTGDEAALGVWTSPDGIDWAKLDSSAFTGDTEHLRMVDDTPQCSWTSNLRPNGSAPGPTVATDGELLVLGCYESIWTSTDGATWTRAPMNTPDYYLPFDVERTSAITLKNMTIIDIAPGPSGWAAVGYGQYGTAQASTTHVAAVWRSADGLTWEIPAANKADFHDSLAWYQAEVDAVLPFADLWIAGGGVRPRDNVDEYNMAVWASPDGSSYATLGDPAHGTVVEPSSQGILALTATPSGLVAVGWNSDDSYMGDLGGFGSGDGSAAAWISADGLSWTRIESEAFTGEGYEVATDVTEGGPGLVAVGGGSIDWERWGAVWVSEDGSSWVRVPPDRLEDPQPLAAIAAGPTGLVAVGGAEVWLSGDFPLD